jgi:hypothetical protein
VGAERRVRMVVRGRERVIRPTAAAAGQKQIVAVRQM